MKRIATRPSRNDDLFARLQEARKELNESLTPGRELTVIPSIAARPSSDESAIMEIQEPCKKPPSSTVAVGRRMRRPELETIQTRRSHEADVSTQHSWLTSPRNPRGSWPTKKRGEHSATVPMIASPLGWSTMRERIAKVCPNTSPIGADSTKKLGATSLRPSKFDSKQAAKERPNAVEEDEEVNDQQRDRESNSKRRIPTPVRTPSDGYAPCHDFAPRRDPSGIQSFRPQTVQHIRRTQPSRPEQEDVKDHTALFDEQHTRSSEQAPSAPSSSSNDSTLPLLLEPTTLTPAPTPLPCSSRQCCHYHAHCSCTSQSLNAIAVVVMLLLLWLLLGMLAVGVTIHVSVLMPIAAGRSMTLSAPGA